MMISILYKVNMQFDLIVLGNWSNNLHADISVSKDQLQFLLSDYTLLSTFCCENDSEVFNDE
jgi:uncharacterized protein YejL (UPF0352 family)